MGGASCHAVRAAHPQPPASSGVRDGLAYDLFLPAGEPCAGVVILHGADSGRLSHLQFARRCAAHGLAAVAFDLRGHGDSGGALDRGVVGDVAAMAALLPPVPLALRGSSMGGYLALVAGAELGAAAVVAICPATGAGLARGVRDGRFGFAAGPALLPFLEHHDAAAAARALGDRLLLLHAEGDEVVPVMVSRELHAAAPASRLVVVPGGHHRSVQHDPELQDLSVRFVLRAARASRA
ncbi:MAG TPA: alpha/beta fold hydrolase [Solirubrobacteraceae bacterium]|nr:alpha/beta fold hydrolase [Solirubrobacteraceae bacterium]